MKQPFAATGATWAICRITFKEGIRQRVLYGAVLFAGAVIFFSVLASGLFMRDIAKITLDICLTAINLGGLLVPFFLAVQMLARDMERRTVYSILSRPLSRSQYVLGKFGGLALLAAALMATLTLATVAAIFLARAMYAPVFFKGFSWGPVFLSIFVSYLGMLVFIAAVVLWSMVTTSSFLATMLTLATYIIGHSVEEMVRFVLSRTPGVEITPMVTWTVRGAQYLFPNLAAFDLKLVAAHGLAVTWGHVGFLIAYAIACASAMLTLAMLVFRKRDLT